jgi:hypothetical protein
VIGAPPRRVPIQSCNASSARPSRPCRGRRALGRAVVQSTKFELVINAQRRGTLGLDVPPTLSARADEVID